MSLHGKAINTRSNQDVSLAMTERKNYPHCCFPIHLSRLCALHFFEIENKQNMP